jgi:hypothetical protein
VSNYDAVERELAAGTQPEVLCATCPWDRLCVQPPAMTKADIQAKMAEAERRDKQQLGKELPLGSLLTAMTFGGRDQAGRMCPVFVLTLRSPEGRKLADSVRQMMRGGGEPSGA